MEKKINEEEKEATLEDIVKNDYQGATIVELNIPTKKLALPQIIVDII